MFFGSVRFLILRSSRSLSNLPGAATLGLPRGFRGYSSVRVAKEKTKYSVIDLVLNSVVKVFCRSSKSSILQPWQKKFPQLSTGSGFVISGNKILTNAHVVADHTFVQVRKHGSPAKYTAKVQAVGHECDLAILEIDSKKFWEDMKPLDLGDVPALNETVHVVGYPRGGDNISITKGVVNRVEVRPYNHSKTKLMTTQIDAAINHGNSGGPVVDMENKIVGVAFQCLKNSENVGYIIPTPVINHFISNVEENNQSFRFCSLGISCQNMENAQIHKHFKMSPQMTGILITKINRLSSVYGILKKDDVLLSIDDVSIENDGTVSFRKKERIDFSHLVSMKKQSETTSLKVLRDGKEHKFDINIKPVESLVPVYQYDKLPSYYIFAGFVFVPLTKPYFDCCDMSESVLEKMPKNTGEQIVIISQVLEDDINVGYTSFENSQVKKVNGVEVENLKHLSQLIKECCSEDLRFELDKEKSIFINKKSAKKVTSKILKRYAIPSAMSKDLRS